MLIKAWLQNFEISQQIRKDQRFTHIVAFFVEEHRFQPIALLSLGHSFRLVLLKVEQDDRQGFLAIDSGGRVNVAIADKGVEVIRQARRNRDVEVSDNNLDAVFSTLVEVVVDEYLTNEVSIFTDGGKKFEYSLDDGE